MFRLLSASVMVAGIAVMLMACAPARGAGEVPLEKEGGTSQVQQRAGEAVQGSQSQYSPEQVLLAVKLEEVRGHLVAARAHAREGRMEVARAHAAHPMAESFPAIQPALDPALAQEAARVLSSAPQLTDPSQFEEALADAERVMDEVEGAVVPSALRTDPAFRGHVLAALMQVVADEYAEAVVDGQVKWAQEYEDAYGFFQRGLVLWRGLQEQVRDSAPGEYREIEEQVSRLGSALPGIALPGQPVAPAQVEAWAEKLGHELAEATGFIASPLVEAGDSPGEQLQALKEHAVLAMEALQSGDVQGARRHVDEFERGWGEIEDGIRAISRESYRKIEDAMAEARYALHADPVEAHRAVLALQRLSDECDAFISGKTWSSGQERRPSAGGPATLPGLVARIERAQARLDAGDVAGAAAEVEAFRTDWTDVEGLVKARSAQAYTAIENNMARAYALLTQQPPDGPAARAVLAQMKSDLAPYVQAEARYGVLDAAIILLREGLEALLVVAALLAFLKKTDNADKGRWVWAGSGVGIAASVLVAFIVNIAFSRAAAGSNREMLEGVTGLVAGAMLVYVSYWLHSKASLSTWQQYIRDKSTAALARNSLISLALIAFLAVFREGAETVLFYVGIAPSITLGDLVLGLGLGAAGLAIIGVLVLAFGVRLPIRPFFLGTSVLVYYLAFKFVGTGIHALQVAGVVGATPSSYLPDSGLLGLYPTWETTAAQATLLLAAAAVILARWLRGRPRLGGSARPQAAG